MVAKTKTSKINYGEPREIKALKPRKGRDEKRDNSVPRGNYSYFLLNI